MASLLYGSGLRLLECCRLRVKDLDFARTEILVRDGKGRKDRVTMLPRPISWGPSGPISSACAVSTGGILSTGQGA